MQLKNEGPDTSTGKLYHGLPSNHIYNGKCCQTATNHHVQQMLFNLISTLSNWETGEGHYSNLEVLQT